MKTKPGWSIVILISSVQLALLLIAVLVLFSWFLGQTEESVGSQTCRDNHVIAEQIVKAIDASELREIRQNGDDLDRLTEILANVRVPNLGFSCVFDARTGKTICWHPESTDLTELQFEHVLLIPLLSESTGPVPLLGSVTNQPGERYSEGRILFGERQHFVSAVFLPQLNSVLLIGQQRNHSMAELSKIVSFTKRFAFAATLVLGMICICLIVATLRRMAEHFNDMSQGLARQVTEREKELVATQNAVVFGLAKLAESRDNDTGEHLDRIRSYVTILANDLLHRIKDVDEEFVHILGLASSLHDIGKVGIPDSILLKPNRLSLEEREVMELHTLIGGECLEAIQARLGNNVFMHTAKQIAYYHHERWDGTGYPHGLSGDEIPLVARIVAVADVYDALTSKRPYKQPMSHMESKGIIVSGSGSQFDPQIVDVFLRHEHEFQAISRSQLSLTDDDVRSEFQALCERAEKSKELDVIGQGI